MKKKKTKKNNHKWAVRPWPWKSALQTSAVGIVHGVVEAVTEAPLSGASAGTPGRDACGGDPCSCVHGGSSPLFAQEPHIKCCFPPPLDEPIREERGAREQVDLKDQTPACSRTLSSAGTSFLRLLDFSVVSESATFFRQFRSFLLVFLRKKKIPAHEFIRENMQFANFHPNNITYGTFFYGVPYSFILWNINKCTF